ncbi:hypothetical protein QBC37DRAFT_454306 [Rhypophila decipiens]|uniref:DUF7791 domain-containing protein n=1 Tax=Rhypophila decipiens TaxID=261697 RepID=A0AAN7B2H9_9PEZI|nr:hypothetical protein QBC37DRAFT_454306 [Rhypophila decipiens]
MDPISAFGLATNILTFINFTREIITTGRDIYQSSNGATATHLESETLTNDIKNRVEKTTFPRALDESLLTDDDKCLRSLSLQCGFVADELLRALDKLRVEGRHTKWKSFYQAIGSIKRKDEIDGLEQRLHRLSAQVNIGKVDKQLAGLQSMLSQLQFGSYGQRGPKSMEIEILQKHMDDLHTQLVDATRVQNIKIDRILEMLNLDYQKGPEIVEEAAEAAAAAERWILSNLRFKSMNDRYLSLDEPHKGTFTWINDPAAATTLHGGSTFLKCLEADRSSYWVSGKLGSGKSTLMRYLCDLPAVQSALKRWANSRGYSEDQLVVPRYFLWSLGRDDLQKSQEGLLRSLLLLSHAAEAKTLLLCFFIDGLDEYKGKPEDMVQLVKVLKSSRMVKMCLSSRPWNEFEKAFGGNELTMLRLQDLTYDDIKLYVQDTLQEDPSFREMKEDDHRCQELIHEIVIRADGVFFWARLVVNSLLQGVTNADRIVDLQRRLGTYPQDLTLLFERELFSVESDYQHATARFFQVTLDTRTILPLMAYWFIDQDDDNNHGSVITMPMEPWPVQRLRRMKRRLNACCKGLLESKLYDNGGHLSSLSSSVLFNLRVDFAHRTVRDFLALENIRERLAVSAGGPSLNSHIAICKGILGQIKATPRDEPFYFSASGPINDLAGLFHAHSKHPSVQHQPGSTARMQQLFDELRRVLEPEGFSFVNW